MSRKAKVAAAIFSSVLFAAMFSKRTAAVLPPWGPPAPSNLPPFPIPNAPLPPVPNWPAPPLPPKLQAIVAGRRYEVTIDLKPASGMGLLSAARAIMKAPQFAGRFADAERVRHDDAKRPGVGEVTRIVLRVTPLVDDSFAIDAEYVVRDAGSVWILKIDDIGGTQ